MFASHAARLSYVLGALLLAGCSAGGAVPPTADVAPEDRMMVVRFGGTAFAALRPGARSHSAEYLLARATADIEALTDCAVIFAVPNSDGYTVNAQVECGRGDPVDIRPVASQTSGEAATAGF